MTDPTCEDCGLPAWICNAKAMVREAAARHGEDAVLEALGVVRAARARVQLAAIVRENCVECAGAGTAREGDGICPYCSQVTPADARAALDRLLAEARAQEREAAWNIPDIELAAILLAYDEAPGCEETFETWRKHWRSRLGQPHDDDTALMDWLEMAQRLAPMVRAAIRARGEAAKAQGGDCAT